MPTKNSFYIIFPTKINYFYVKWSIIVLVVFLHLFCHIQSIFVLFYDKYNLEKWARTRSACTVVDSGGVYLGHRVGKSLKWLNGCVGFECNDS